MIKVSVNRGLTLVRLGRQKKMNMISFILIRCNQLLVQVVYITNETVLFLSSAY